MRGSIATEQDSRIISWNELDKSMTSPTATTADYTRASVKFEDERAEEGALEDEDEAVSDSTQNVQFSFRLRCNKRCNKMPRT